MGISKTVRSFLVVKNLKYSMLILHLFCKRMNLNIGVSNRIWSLAVFGIGVKPTYPFLLNILILIQSPLSYT